MNSKLYYLNEAKDWNEALPLGNGVLGAMFFGGVQKETLQVNEQSIWAGPPVPENRVGAYNYIETATKLLRSEQYLEAQKVIQDNVMSKRISPRSYQPLGEIQITLDGVADYTEYSRELDISTAIGTTRWSVGDTKYKREVFISSETQSLICHTTCSEEKRLSGSVFFEREGDINIETLSENSIKITGQAEHNGKHKGVKFSSIINLYLSSGISYKKDNRLIYKNASTVTVILSCKTDYNFKDPYNPFTKYEEGLFNDKINYDHIKENHIKSHQIFYNKIELLIGEKDNRPTDVRLKDFQNIPNVSLIILYFNYARYLTICSTSPGTMCSNLQGIWNKDMEAAWNSDYHININIQMIYWLVEAVGLSDFHKPFFDYVEALVPNGKKSAKEVYNCRGTVVHHTSDVWRFTAPCGEVEYGMWPLGAGWNSRHFMEHFNYTGDKDFLLNRALPYIKEASLFFLDYLVKDSDSNFLILGPSSSPENMFHDPKNNDECNLTLGASMSQQIVWETFYNYLKCLEILEITDQYQYEIKNSFNNLKLPIIASDGRILEWDKEFKEVDPGHRHISHIYGIYPGFQLCNNNDFLIATEKTLNKRLESGGGHTGWSRAWIINLWARLKNGQKAWDNIKSLINLSTLPNLFDNHPPFQLDGNIGGAAGIIEMLVQSHNGNIELLPSIPKELKDGEVRGLRARGGFIIDMAWSDSKIVKLEVKSLLGNKLLIVIPNNNVNINLNTTTGQRYKIIPTK